MHDALRSRSGLLCEVCCIGEDLRRFSAYQQAFDSSEGLECSEGDVVQDAETVEGGQLYGEIGRYETTAKKIREWKQWPLISSKIVREGRTESLEAM